MFGQVPRQLLRQVEVPSPKKTETVNWATTSEEVGPVTQLGMTQVLEDESLRGERISWSGLLLQPSNEENDVTELNRQSTHHQ